MLAKDENIDFDGLADQPYDNFMGIGSGAGVIFGNTGGVMELLYAARTPSLLKKLLRQPCMTCSRYAGWKHQGSQCRHRRAGSKGCYRLRHGQCPQADRKDQKR